MTNGIKLPCLAMVTIILWIGFSSPISANSVLIQVDQLNVRLGPGEGYERIGQVHTNQSYEILSEKNDWIQIDYNNQKGWIAGWLVNKTQSDFKSSSNNPLFLTFQYNNTNLRSGPSTKAEIVGKGQKHDQFEVIEKQGDWYKVKYDQSESYVAGWIVDVQEPIQYETEITGILKNKTIIIDAGHGGKDPGATAVTGFYEKELTLQTAIQLKRQLENAGVKVLMTRLTDKYLSLRMRSFYSNISNADLFISLHYNSAPNIEAKGIGTYYFHEQNKELAASIQNKLVEFSGLYDQEIKFGNFSVIRENNKPALLIELGFISNAEEAHIVNSKSFQENVSIGITNGLIDYFSE